MAKAAFIVSLFIILCSCENKSQKNVSNQQSLNGTWQFLASITLDEKDLFNQDFSKWDTLQVPGNWDTRERYSEYVGKGYYQKVFSLPETWIGKQVRLKFDAVYETAKVWLNGELLGEHIGGYTPFEFNITNRVDFTKDNTVVVMANNTYKRGAWWAWGGISRDVNLYANEDIRLIYQHISSVPDFESGRVNFSVKYKVENKGNETQKIQVLSKISGKALDTLNMTVRGNSDSFLAFAFQEDLSNYKLWHFNSPNLYEYSTELILNNNVVSSGTDKIGIRKFEVRDEQFFLNNEPVRMNGINRVHDHPEYGNTEPDALVLRDMQDIKSLGCNFSRLMHAPLSKNLLEVCDSIGFLLVEEIPVWGDDDPQAYKDNPLTKKWMKEMIERDYNHPSVVAWSVGNELRENDSISPSWAQKKMTQDQYDYANSMLDYVAELDPSRLKTYVTITSYRQGDIGTEPYEKVDFISMNSYGNAPKLAVKTNQKFPGKPIFISEIGLGQIGGAKDSKLSDKLVQHITLLKNLPYVTGISVWSYNDYRSNYRGTPESGFREWGIVNENRGKKEAYNQFKALNDYWSTKTLKEQEK